MGDVLTIIGGYFFVGFSFLLVLDVATGRIRNRLMDSAADAQQKLWQTYGFVGKKTAILLILATTWLLWPLVLWGAATTIGGRKNG